jgi:hypothetical protein
MNFPGLKVKRALNLSRVLKNARLTEVEYLKNMVSLGIIINEGSDDQQIYKYKSKTPFKGEVEEEKSFLKV